MKKLDINPRQIAFVGLGIILVLYVLFQARFLILGPSINIYSPKDGQSVDSSAVVVMGHAENISYISLDDRPIFVDEKGDFSEKLIASPGTSIIKMNARDRFGRTAEKTIKIVYNN